MSTQQWANIGDDEGAMHALLQRVLEHVPLQLVDYVWIFPPRKVATGESIVIVVGAFDADERRRRVLTAHFTIARSRKGQAAVTMALDEHGSAPHAAVPRIVDGVLRRLGADAEAPPREEQIGGSSEKWDALIVDLGGRPAAQHTAATEDASEPDASAQDAAEQNAGTG